MNRKMRRELRKDKNLIKEVYSIIQKHLPDLLQKFQDLTDTRNQSYVTYSMKTICVTRIFGLLCGLTSLNDLSKDKFDNDKCIQNISTICKQDLIELPYWETIQDVFITMSIEELREIQKYIVKTLLRSKMFDKYKYKDSFQLLFDGTGLSNHNYNLNDNCLIRKHKDGKISYYKYVLECKLVVGNIVISLDSEFIENESMLTEKQKQDCETKAFKRMIKRIKKTTPNIILLSQVMLYMLQLLLLTCVRNNWNYIFNFKPDRLKFINDSFEGNLKLLNETSISHYYLSTNIEFNKNFINVIKYIEKKNKNETTFRYITDLLVVDDSIKDIVRLGRNRWKIENNGFHMQKHGSFNISHMCSRNDNSMKCHYFFIQVAHTIRQLLEQGNLITKSLNLKLKEVSDFILDSLTSITSDLNHLETNFQLRFDT